ncbi:hypothetical protein LguiA_012616 [Lonicera macranthoides]
MRDWCLIKRLKCVVWNLMISAYSNNGSSKESLQALMQMMKSEGFRIHSMTVINILPACVNLGVLKQVKYLVSYAKSGYIEMARKIFYVDELNTKDIITWNSMISAYSKHRDWLECFNLYNKMKQSKLKPDRMTFLGLLTACD